MSYRCVEVVNNVCSTWVESSFPVMTTGEAVAIGGAFLGLTAIAFCCRSIAGLILNRF